MSVLFQNQGPFLFVPDLHGEKDIFERCMSTFSPEEYFYIFVSDFPDSFHRSVADQVWCAEKALELKKVGRAEINIGNHDLSYYFREWAQCSGWNMSTNAAFFHLKESYLNAASICTIIEGGHSPILITHAGMSKKSDIYRELLQEVDENPVGHDFVETLTKYLEKLAMKYGYNETLCYLAHVGRIRGGLDEVGGIFWCHYPEEFTAIPNVRQIFGHTKGDYIRTYDSQNFCIDCWGQRQKDEVKTTNEVLILENDIFSLRTF